MKKPDPDKILNGIAALLSSPIRTLSAGELKMRNDNDPLIGHARLLAARRLSEEGFSESWVQSILNCSLAHVRLADKLATRDQDPDANYFRVELKKLRGEPDQPVNDPKPDTGPDPIAEKKPSSSATEVADRIFRIVEETYGFTRAQIQDPRRSQQQVNFVRMLIAFVGREAFLMNEHEIARMLAASYDDTAKRILADASSKYGVERKFTEAAKVMCRLLGATLGPKMDVIA